MKPASPSILGDLEALGNHKRRVFEKIEIRLPKGGYVAYKPHKHQQRAHFPLKPLTHQMLACGRRGGKTQFDIGEVVAMMAIDGTMTWVGAPTYKLTDRVFQPLYRLLVIEKVLGAAPVRERNSAADRYIEMPWGAIVEGKSAERPDSAKGASLDLFIDDECAEHGEEFFTEYVEPGLADREGRAIFTSTPMGLTWFHEYFKRGQSPKHPTWKSYTWKSIDNPFLNQEWLTRKKTEVSSQVWRQEYCAEFIARSGLVWEDYRDEYFDGPNRGHLFNPDCHPIDPSWTHYRGIDIGTYNPAGCVWGAVDPQKNLWVHDEYWEKKPLHEEHARAIAARTLYGPMNSFISWEAHTADGKGGRTPLQIYQDNGVYAQQVARGPEIRVDAVASYLRAALEDSSPHPAIYISDRCRHLRAQIKKYRHKDLKPNADSGKLKVHRKGKGDDLCDALGHLCVTKPSYAPGWLEESNLPIDEVERYGYQDASFVRDSRAKPVLGIPGLATLPRVDQWR